MIILTLRVVRDSPMGGLAGVVSMQSLVANNRSINLIHGW